MATAANRAVNTMMFHKLSSLTFMVLKILSIVTAIISEQSVLKGPLDVCERDVFNGSCPSGEVMMMQSAMYGRMEVGKCLRKFIGNTNCDIDVLHIMDGICSGVQSCTVRPTNPSLLDAKPCPDHTAYLSLSYKCIQDSGQLSSSCSNNMAITSSRGFLFSASRSVYGPGTIACPWTLSSDGQRYNITLLKFIPSILSPLASSSLVCFEVGTIEEAGLKQGILTCGSDHREKVLFLSKGGPIRINFKDKNFLADLGNFAVHFSELGCSDPTIPHHATLERTGDSAMVTCKFSDNQWQVKCNNGEWDGEIGECPAEGLLALVTIGCALTIFLGGFCIYATSFYIQGKQRQQNTANADYTMDIYKLQTMQRLKRPPSIAAYERTTSLPTPPGTMRRNTDYQRMNPIDPDTVSHHSYVLYDHVPKPLPPIPIQENKHIYETPLRPDTIA